MIIPFSEEENFLQLSADFGLYPSLIINVRGTKNSSIKRSLICLGFHKTTDDRETLILEKKRHEYTDEYLQMVKDFIYENT